MRAAVATIILSAAFSTAALAQTITFQNATPAPVQIRLQSGSQLGLDAQGNVSAFCDSTDQQGCARLAQGSGSCGNPPVFQAPLAPNPNPGGPVAPGATVTLQASLTDAVVCVPSAVRVSPLPEQPTSIVGWNSSGAAIFPPQGGLVGATVTMPSVSSASYRFSLTCYGASGSASSQTTITTTDAAPPPPPPSCTQFPSSPFTNAAPGQAAGVAISGITSQTINGFESLQSIGGTLMFPFPERGGFGVVNGPPTRVRSIRFTVPQSYAYTGNQEFVWAEYPNNWLPPTQGYVSVSECAGDFRVPNAAQGSQGGDLTFADGCRNWRAQPPPFPQAGFVMNSNIKYEVSATASSTGQVCVLRPGATYFFNIYINRPDQNRTLPPLPSPPNTLCGDGAECGIRVQLRD